MKYSLCTGVLWVLTALVVSALGIEVHADDTPLAPEVSDTASVEVEITTWRAEMANYQKPSDEELRKRLTGEQYKITQEDGTEPAFQNEYWNNKREGIYVDIVSGEPLFSSQDKFDSGTGWPSFIKPLEKAHIVETEDRTFFMKRTEVRSKYGNSHLGHIFPDGPGPSGQRYCINSASLRFIPKEDLEKEGYAEYRVLFEGPK